MHLRSLITVIMAFGCASHASANQNLHYRDGPTPTTHAVLPTDPVRLSVLSVLVTAIPASQLSKAVHDEKAFSAEIASSLAAGKTPEWFIALPSDVKSLLPSLYPAQAAVLSAPATTSAPTSSASSSASSASTATPSSTPSSASAAAAATSTSSTGAAARPTAVVGAGIVGAVGMLGMLVL